MVDILSVNPLFIAECMLLLKDEKRLWQQFKLKKAAEEHFKKLCTAVLFANRIKPDFAEAAEAAAAKGGIQLIYGMEYTK